MTNEIVPAMTASPRADTQLWSALLQARLRLADQLQFTEQLHRGQVWVVIQDPVRSQFYKTTPEVYRLLQHLDGSRTLAQTFAAFPDLHADFADQPQVPALLAQLLDAGLLQSDRGDYSAEIDRQVHKEKKLGRLRWHRPWMVKLPLFNPDRLLDGLYQRTRWLWTRPAFVLWLVTVTAAAAALVDYLPYLREFWRTRFLDPVNLALLLVTYPLLKACHEIAHGLTTKKWGGRVYEMGLMFLLFMPVPYVDASASTQFANKYQRMLVAASGVMTELLLAALALLVWINSESILVKDICMNIMLIGAVSTLLFNGNPLLRFDGYYVLSDWLEIPNLASRSSQYLGYLWHRLVLGISAKTPQLAAGEKKWLLGYGLLAGCYRLVISFGVALYIAGHYFFVGVILAFWALLLQILLPLAQALRNSFNLAHEHSRLWRWLLSYSLMATLLVLGLFVVPVRHSTQAPALLIMAGPYEIKTGAEGFLGEILVTNGEQVVAGQPLLIMHNPSLPGEITSLKAQLVENEVLLNRALTHEPLQVDFYRDERVRLQQELADLEENLANLTLLARADGVVEIPGLENQLGRYFSQGERLGHLVAPGAAKILAIVPERAGDFLAAEPEAVRVKLHAHPHLAVTAANLRPVPQAVHHLPDPYFGSLFGGPIAVDTSEPEGTRALEPVFQVEMDLVAQTLPPPLAGRAQVQFVHHSQPLGIRLLRYWRLELLRRFNI